MSEDPTLPHPIDSDDKRPLPLIVAERWGFPLQHHLLEDNVYFSVLDWIRGVAQITDAKQSSKLLNHLKKRIQKAGDESSPSWRTLPYRATDGKTYKRDYTDAQGLYSITQRLDVNTGLRNVILSFLAKSGVFVDTMRRDSQARAEFGATAGAEAVIDATIGSYLAKGRDENWIAARLDGVITRKQFTTALKEAVLYASANLYGKGTDKIYSGLWKRTTAELRADLGIKKKDSLRDNFGEYALIYTRLAEKVATDRLRDVEIVTESIAMEIVYEAAKLISKQAEATSKALGVDLVTQNRC